MTKKPKTFKIVLVLTQMNAMQLSAYNQGPPDLEAFLKKAFSKLLPQKRPSLKDFQPPQEKGFNNWWVIIPFVILVSILLSGMITVKAGEVVVLSRFGIYQKTLMPGLHWTIPLVDRHVCVDTADTHTVTISEQTLTQDQYMINANVSLNYKVIDAKTYLFASQNVDNLLQAYLQAATLQALSTQSFESLLNKENFPVLAKTIQSDLALSANQYGIALQNVTIQGMNVPNALNGQFMQVISQAQNQVKAQIQNAQAYKAAIAPVATQRAQEIQQAANFKRVAIIIAAQANVAEFNALLPAYQNNPAVTSAYLPMLLLADIKNLAPHQSKNPLTTDDINVNSAQNAYSRWQSANQSQNNVPQD